MKKFVMGLIVGIVFATAASVYAEDGLTKVEAYLRPGLPITLDGKSITLDNSPVMYDGSTYLKLRDISKLTGMGVNWNDATQTVELTSTGGQTVETTPTPTPSATATPTTNLDVTETAFNGLRAITLNGETYFSLKDYNDKFDPYLWGYDATTNTVYLAENEKGTSTIKRKLVEVNKNDPIAFTIKNGESFINVKYYEAP